MTLGSGSAPERRVYDERRGPGFEWVEQDRPTARPDGHRVSVKRPGDLWRAVPTNASRPEDDRRSALMESLVDLTFSEEPIEVFLGVWAQGGPRDVIGVVVRATFIGADGQPSRFPNPAAWAVRWMGCRLGDAALCEAHGPVHLFTFSKPVSRGVALQAWEAAAKMIDASLHADNARPEEYAEGRWRPGLVVDRPDDPIIPFRLPNRESLATSILMDRYGEEFTAEELIARAAEIAEVPPCERPPIVEVERERGVVGRFVDSFMGRMG